MIDKRILKRIRWDRVAMVFGPLILLIILICGLVRSCGKEEPVEESSAVSAESTTTATTTVPSVETTAIDDFIVVLDPGHGAHDGGTKNQDGTRLEKDDNLTMGLAVYDALKAYPNVHVILTRDTDVFVTLEDRCKIANDANADLFVSLHRNSADEGKGVEIWVNDSDEKHYDKLLAQYIMEMLEKVGISKDRGIRNGFRGTSGANADNSDDSYYVNAHTNMPSCLIELGFLTSDEDNKNFDSHLKDYADNIARAIVEFGEDKEMYQPTVQN